MKKYITALLLAIALVQIPAFAGEKNENCIEYDPAIVNIAGTFYKKTFPGPPEYSSIEEGDRPETFWILSVEKPICVWAPPDVEDGNSTEYNVNALQLVLKPQMYARYRHLLTKEVIVTGLLSHRTTGHHHTRVMIDVKNIKSVKPDKSPFVITSSAIRIPCL